VSLRRFRYQLRCAAKGHDTRPYLVGGSVVEHRCLRCGALVGDSEPAAASGDGLAAPMPDDDSLPHAGLPAPIAANGATVHAVDDGSDDGEEPGNTALAALRDLADLHASGVVTDDEFAAKKAELLRRV
jgi:Short C-terminal domain